LYDPIALANSPLAERFPQSASAQDMRARAIALRSILLDAIELLQPTRAAARSPTARCYEVLALHFLEGMSMAEIAARLHISERHAYRDLARAEEKLAELLHSMPWVDAPMPNAQGEDVSPVHVELQSLSAQPRDLDAIEILHSAVRTVEPLARERQVRLRCTVEPESFSSFADESLLRQTLVLMLSVAIRNSTDSEIIVLGTSHAHSVRVGVRVTVTDEQSAGELFGEVRDLAEAQHIQWDLQSEPDGSVEVSLFLPARKRHSVLVIEDNPGAVELYRRYLTASGEWQLVQVPTPRLSFEMARRLQPAAIILDILMPQQDGWSILQMLRTQPETADVPIIVCSVYDELDLAYSLGATAYIKKPISQLQLMSVLRDCLRHRLA